MSKLIFTFVFAMLVLSTGCQKSKSDTKDQASKDIITTRLHFVGFAKSKSGATWMAWPDAVNEALSELSGIEEVQVKLEQDEFVVSYDASKVNEKQLLAACERSGFPATIKSGSESFDLPKGKKSNREYSAPDFYAEALDVAKRDRKPIILDFMATWCAPCKRIGNETFVEENVAKLLEGCVLLKIDTDEHPGIAQQFGVSGLPDIRFLDSNGIEVKKLLGFQEAGPFAIELQQLLNQIAN